MVYGESACLARELRGFGGRLNVTVHPVQGKDLLPQSPSHPECKAPSGYCFIAGIPTATVHFILSHSRLAEKIMLATTFKSPDRASGHLYLKVLPTQI